MRKVLFILFIAVFALPAGADACTVISVGKEASHDGSVMTSHTCDSHRTASDLQVVPPKDHKEGAELQLTHREDDDTGPMERYLRAPSGPIPQVRHTYGYLAPAYAAMNEHQVAIGESTFTGRKEMESKAGLIDCETLTRLMLERARTAREALDVGTALIEKYGWIDTGEVLTIADPTEVWHLEIIGPGEGKVGAIWAARRIPDGHVSVVANASRLRRLDADDPDVRMSDNVVPEAVARGWWDPESGDPFEFCMAYNPDGRASASAHRREWRAFDLLAPSLELKPGFNHYPFSVKPDEPVTPLKIMEILRDTYEGTPFDMVKDFIVVNEKGEAVKSPLANPFMPYDMNKMLRINGGWSWRGERSMARWYCMYATVTQSQARFPGPVGGIVWFGLGNPAMATYVPVFAGITALPESFRTDGRTTGFSRDAAWWAFNRVATIAAHRWGDMRKDVAKVRDPVQAALFTQAAEVQARAAALWSRSPRGARKLLTDLTSTAAQTVLAAYWRLGDHLWTAYDEKW